MTEVKFDYSKLRGKIREIFRTQSAFAEAMGISSTSLSAKLNNNVEFTQKEIDKAVELLKIAKEDIPTYFFTLEVQEIELNK
jgi:transcriptional regulator with XRE-family HTH domain